MMEESLSWRYNWYKEGSTISGEFDHLFINTHKFNMLLIRDFFQSSFKCFSTEVVDFDTPKPRVTIKPDHHVFRGETVTLRCDIYDGGVTSWRYNWYKDGSTSVFSEGQQHTFSSVTESDAGKYSCNGTETEGSRWSHHSDEVTLTVSGEFDHLFINTHKFNMLLMSDLLLHIKIQF
ncbi:hypothetical protein PO909_002428 [Leuciscus waleckii]